MRQPDNSQNTPIGQDAAAFMHAVFDGSFSPLERPAIAAQLQDGRAPVNPWPDTRPQQQHTHFSVGLFEYNTVKTARDGFKRRFDRCTGVRMLLLDDILEKATPPRIKPTIKIETKKGSQQFLYLFKEPCRDLVLIDQMMRTLAEAGHADAGGSTGKTASIRLGRLPGSDPKGRGHPARVVWSDMTRLFPSDPALLFGPNGFDLPMEEARPDITETVNSVLIDPQGDPLLAWLSKTGRVLGPMGGAGWVPILCPWHSEHSGGATGGTHYQVASPRGFQCFHNACGFEAGVWRRPVDFLTCFARLGAPVAPPDPPSGEHNNRLRTRYEGGTLTDEAWATKDGPRGAEELGKRLAWLAMPYPDIRETLIQYCHTPPAEAAAIAYHNHQRAERLWLDRQVPDDMAERVNNIPDPFGW